AGRSDRDLAQPRLARSRRAEVPGYDGRCSAGTTTGRDQRRARDPAMKLVVLAVVAACTRGGDPPRSMQAPTASTPQDSTMASLLWRPQPIAKRGLAIDVVDGTAVDERDAGAIHALQQFHPKFQLGAWLGKDASLAWWRNRFLPAANVGPETPLQVCGR